MIVKSALIVAAGIAAAGAFVGTGIAVSAKIRYPDVEYHLDDTWVKWVNRANGHSGICALVDYQGKARCSWSSGPASEDWGRFTGRK